MSEIAIEVEGLTKSFDGHVVVHDLTLQVPKGSIFGFLGPNGSGKTTTIRMLCGLLTPDSGTGTCLGHDILTEADLIKRQVGYMTQRFSLYEDLSIRENLEFVSRVYGVDEPRQAARQAIERLGLEGRARTACRESCREGGNRGSHFGACILPEPQLLLLDEPTAGVDPKARREFWDEDPPTGGGRHHGAGFNPLYGRGRAVPRNRLYRLRPSADPRHGGECDQAKRPDHMECLGRQSHSAGRKAYRFGWRGHGRSVWHVFACCRTRPQTAGKEHFLAGSGLTINIAGHAANRTWRTCSST